MEGYTIRTICATAVIAVGLAMMCHELAHVVAGRLAGGTPTMITSTEVKGNFDALSPLGFVALGASGSLVNVVFAAMGWWGLRRWTPAAGLRLFSWFFFAVNGMIVALAMAGESLIGFGDWMTILHKLPGTIFLRVLFTALGFAGVVFMVRRSGITLGRLLPAGEPGRRAAEARRIVLVGAAASAILVLGSSVASPVGTTRGALLALGAGVGPFLPMMSGTRFVSRTASEVDQPISTGGWPWLVGAAVVTAVLWFVFGPGLVLRA